MKQRLKSIISICLMMILTIVSINFIPPISKTMEKEVQASESDPVDMEFYVSLAKIKIDGLF